MSQNSLQPQGNSPVTKPARKPYVAPLLEDYGTVRELTRTVGNYTGAYTDATFYLTSLPG